MMYLQGREISSDHCLVFRRPSISLFTYKFGKLEGGLLSRPRREMMLVVSSPASLDDLPTFWLKGCEPDVHPHLSMRCPVSDLMLRCSAFVSVLAHEGGS